MISKNNHVRHRDPAPWRMPAATAAFLGRPLDFLQDLHARWGDHVRMRLGLRPFHFLRDPALARDVLVRRNTEFPLCPIVFGAIRPLAGDRGLVQLQGAPWRDLRRQLAPSFGSRALASYVPLIDRRIDRRLAGLETRVDAFPFAVHLALELASLALFGVEVESEVGRLADAFATANRVLGDRLRFPGILAMSPRRRRELRDARVELDVVLARIAAQAPANPLLSVLRADGVPLQQVRTILFAGHETLASSLAFALDLLARDPAWQEKLAAEADLVLDAGAATYAQVAKLQVARAVYQEALRLNPPAWILARAAAAATELGGRAVGRGDAVIISVRELHRHPMHWSAPDAFRPDRFLVPRAAESGAFLPFGLGGKHCIGAALAMAEGPLLLARMVQRFRLAPAGGPLTTQVGITARPRGGVPLILSPRRHCH